MDYVSDIHMNNCLLKLYIAYLHSLLDRCYAIAMLAKKSITFQKGHVVPGSQIKTKECLLPSAKLSSLPSCNHWKASKILFSKANNALSKWKHDRITLP